MGVSAEKVQHAVDIAFEEVSYALQHEDRMAAKNALQHIRTRLLSWELRFGLSTGTEVD